MKTKHTKGKWSQDVVNKQQITANGIKIANVIENIEANAKLIAAAPDMLEALQSITGVLASLHLVGIKLPDDCYDAVALCLAAIKKATE